MTEKYSKKFERAVDYVIKNEGGYVFDQNDYGGATKYGISQKAFPALNIRELSLEDAIEIYHKDFWLKGKFEQIPDENIAIKVFDFTVNLGQRAATIILQRALRSVGINVQEDGLFGSVTLSATISCCTPECAENRAKMLLAALKSEAAGYYRLIAAKNPSQKKFLNGWLNRAYRNV